MYKLKGRPSAAQVVGEIDDLLLQILHNLPLKSLGKFKTLSKRWLSLVKICSQNPRPVRALLLQYHRNNPDLDLLPLHNNTEDEEEEKEEEQVHLHSSLRFLVNDKDVDKRGLRVLRSCNGLLLCGRHWDGCFDTMDYYVYNPVTRQHATLPSVLAGRRNVHLAASLVYEPSRSPHYKVVVLAHLCRIRSTRTPSSRSLMIYSSETRSWRRWDDTSFQPGLETVGICNNMLDTNNGVFWNGSIYYTSDYMQRSLHRFDTDSETMERARLPRGRRRVRLLTASWGRLYLMMAKTCSIGQFTVYEMVNNEWLVKYKLKGHFDLDMELKFTDGLAVLHLPAQLDRRYIQNCQLFFSPPGDDNGEDELWLVLRAQRKVLRCNLKTGKVTVAEAPHKCHVMAHDLMHSILDLPSSSPLAIQS